MPHDPESAQPRRPIRKWIAASAGILIVGSAVFVWNSDFVLFPAKQTSTVLVLDNCDKDFRTPPFEDTLTAFGPNGVFSRIATNLNLCQTVGGGRCLSVSHDGKFFVVCEMVGKHLIAYDTATGKQLWSADGEFTAATVGRNGIVYAVISSGTIYGDRTVTLDQQGRLTKVGMVAGFDMALDEEHKALWLVGKHIRKCDLDLNVLREINPIKWCVVSVDVNPDGSIWIAERDHPNVAQSSNRIVKISASGEIVKSVNLEWSPLCLRADRSDGSLWVTGVGVSPPVTKRILDRIERRTGTLPIGKKIRDFLTRERAWPRTCKYDSSGKLLRKLNQGGHSIDIQQYDGSVWLAGMDKIYRLSREGTKLARLGGVSADQKYVVVVPEKVPAH